MSTSSAEAPLQPPAPRKHSPHDRRRCSRGGLLIAIRADSRTSKPRELPGAVPKQAPLSADMADVNQLSIFVLVELAWDNAGKRTGSSNHEKNT